MTPRKTFGQFLRGLRVRRGLTQWDVAREFEFTCAQYISNIERGVTFPSDDMLPRLAKIFRTPLTDILNEMTAAKEAEIKAWKKNVLALARSA